MILVFVGSVVAFSWIILALRWLQHQPDRKDPAPPEPPAPVEFLGGIQSLDGSATGRLGGWSCSTGEFGYAAARRF